MIERAATCLENGGRNIIRIPKRPYRTHRFLHSTFWSHGAGDINLPAWWLAFLQVPIVPERSPSPQKNSPITSTSVDGIGNRFLDFLYPVRTLAFIRKCVGEEASTIRHQRRSQLLLQRSRAYTSAADVAANEQSVTDNATQVISSVSAAEDVVSSANAAFSQAQRMKKQFHESLYAEGQHFNTRHIWQVYEEIRSLSISLDPGDLAQLFKRLSSSSSAFNLEKTQELFHDIPSSDRRAFHYTYTISAALKENDLFRAVTMHREASSQIQGSFGTSLIFKYAVEHSEWETVLDIWQDYWDQRQDHVRKPDLWDEFDNIPLADLMHKAVEAIEYANKRINALSVHDRMAARSLALSLVLRALQVRNADFDPSVQLHLVDQVQRIQRPSLKLLKTAINQNLSNIRPGYQAYSEAAISLYRQLRGELGLEPYPELLNAMLKRFHAAQDARGLYEVLEDYQRSHEELPKSAYSLLMSGLARHGDFDTVDQMFQQGIAKFGTEIISGLARTLLYACFRRAEVDRAVSVFETLQQKYNYEPDLKSWSYVLATYARVGACDGALAWFKKLEASKFSPDASAYGILMGMFAKRSDYDATNALYEQAKSEGVKPSFEMIDSLVLAQTGSDRFEEAYRTVEAALDMDLQARRPRAPDSSSNHARTRMWNTLLNHCALRGELDKVLQIHKHMSEVGVPYDSTTYASLMQSLCLKKMPGAANRILKTVMPRDGVEPTALHYSILMSGYLLVNQHHAVVTATRQMLQNTDLKPTFGTRNNLLRAVAKIDEKEHRNYAAGDDSFVASRAEAVLSQTLATLDPMELAPLGPTKFAKNQPPNIALYTSYFSYMILLYGREKSFDKVGEMLDKYFETARRLSPNGEASPPIEILSALMVSYNKARDYTKTEESWNLVVDKAKQIACKAQADTSQSDWVLHRYRFLLSLPLTRYMQSLQATSRVDDIHDTVTSLRHAGYQLSVHNWNAYIQILAQDGRALPAFELCEEHLITGWPGWDHFGDPVNMKGKIKKGWAPKSWELGRATPHYETFVYLAGAHLDLQAQAYGKGDESLEELKQMAPKTVESVLRMPRFNDEIQRRVLRRD
ncbi:MAG: hypothetical protein Q9220_003728 [cf. Caloplaca sp. 1 TL-2023]